MITSCRPKPGTTTLSAIAENRLPGGGSLTVTAGNLFGTTRVSHVPLPLAPYVAIAGGVSVSCPAQNGQLSPRARVAASTNSFGRPARSPPMITQRRDNGSWRYSDIDGWAACLPHLQPLALFLFAAAGTGVGFDVSLGAGRPRPVLLHSRLYQLSPSGLI